jgi:hypothetical protein
MWLRAPSHYFKEKECSSKLLNNGPHIGVTQRIAAVDVSICGTVWSTEVMRVRLNFDYGARCTEEQER